ncbi:sulfurase [Rhizobium sp. Leaf384]|uniref:MOSC domain-containing protein n=1 Tax=unclassified Rhizobium TaxID=2613769 RepID=UPI0007126132|nr:MULTISPECIES: MOSC domain-containing protein [unclassified Rhizobium]KQS80537.1 sulfurase [Rhizobium sp. Leaf384]KQS86588.1 sulfurase [Rhizobium sp. Leaf383]
MPLKPTVTLNARVAALNIHPLKSGRAIAVEQADVRLDGFVGDRRFMLVDPEGSFITQRELPSLAQVTAVAQAGGVHLTMGDATLSASFVGERRLTVRVWSSVVDTACADDAVNATLSSWLARPVRLVFMDDRAERSLGAEWAGEPAAVGFADGFPLLITTTGSLDALNRTLVSMNQPAVGMDRFRTNIVIDHDAAWDEDLWEAVEIGGIRFDLVKPCARCVVTTQDQETGERTGGNPIEGLRMERLSADRRVPGVVFGWNAVPRGTGRIALGNAVRLLSTRNERWPMKRRG